MLRKVAILLPVVAAAWTVNVPYRWGSSPVLRTAAGDTIWSFDTVATAGSFPKAFPIREGGLSDLALDPTDPTGSTFWSITDRGPLVDLASRGKVYPAANYHQKLLRLRADGDGLVAVEIDSVRDAAGRVASGRVSPLHSTGEILFPMPDPDSALAPPGGTTTLAGDSAGFDFEGVAPDGEGGMFLSDEMGPWIAHLPAPTARGQSAWDGTWAMDTVFRPGKGLPAVLYQRDPNSGLEALCRTPGGKLVSVMQSPLPNAVARKRRSDMLDSSRLHRIVVRSPDGTVSEYAYLNDTKSGKRQISNIKVGACTALGEDRIVVVEHGKTKNRAYQIDLWTVDLAGADDIHLESDPDSLGRIVSGQTLEELAIDSSAFVAAISPAQKTLLLGDIYTYTPWPTTKPEGLARVDDSTVALVSDNDFGIQPVNGDGIPHVLNADERVPVLMYLRTKSMGAASARTRSSLSAGVRVRSVPGGWEIESQSVSVDILDLAGRRLESVGLEGGRGFLSRAGLPRGLLVASSGSASALLPSAR